MKIKQTDIRIGNIVEFRGNIYPIYCLNVDNTVRLKCDDTTHENYSHGSIGCFYITDINPVKLTKDVLYKFFWVNHNDLFFHKSNKLSYIKEKAYGCNGNYGYCLNDEKEIYLELKFLHELQNLCLVMGEEI